MLLRIGLLLAISKVVWATIHDEVETCVESGFGNTTFVCDPHGRLNPSTVEKLQNLLTSLQQKISCNCPDGCVRANGNDNYIGLILVTNSFASANLSSDMERIYRDRGLGNSSCSHGLLLVYLKDTQKLASYHGQNTFVLLTDEDMAKLHEYAKKGDNEGDTLALQYLLNNYQGIVESPVQKAEVWTPMVGLVVAILIVLLILVLLLALFFARFCCCCVKRKKDMYRVTPVPTYKTIDPIYVVTPPTSDRFGLTHSDALYSTPYSGSPLPLPYPPPPGNSRPITPSSNNTPHRIRARPSALGPDTPKTKRAQQHQRVERVQSDRSDLGDYAAVAGDYSTMRDNQQVEMYSSLPRPIGSPRSDGSSAPLTENDLFFLDPKRKLETQTREEMIY